MQRCFTNILSDSVEKTAQFYEQLLGMTRLFDSDWYVQLTHPGMPHLEFGVLQRTHETVHESVRNAPTGVVITFVVEDCTAVHSIAIEKGVTVVEQPTEMPYGQLRMLLQDPDGTMVDISSPIS